MQGVDNDSNLFPLAPKASVWYSCYVLNGENLTDQGLILFCNRFWLQYHCSQELLQELKESGEFDCWKDGATDKSGVEASPMSLLPLGALRYI